MIRFRDCSFLICGYPKLCKH